jgi:hypothetical protein
MSSNIGLKTSKYSSAKRGPPRTLETDDLRRAEAGHLFDERERAALAWAETATRVAETGVPDEAYQAARAVFEIVQAVMVGHWAGFFQHALAAILFGVLALIFLVRPMITAEVLTLVMALFFLVGGLFQIVGSAVLGFSGWGWHLIDGLITIVLGLMILAQWPASGLWVIGLFIGIDLIFYGLAWIAIALGLRGGA